MARAAPGGQQDALGRNGPSQFAPNGAHHPVPPPARGATGPAIRRPTTL